MTETLTSHSRRPAVTRRRAAAIVLMSIVGGAILAFPSGSEWFSAVSRSDAIARYTEHVDEVDAEERSAAIASARAYNNDLRDSPLSDPYIADASRPRPDAAGDTAYNEELSIETGGPMARLRMPSFDIDLPIYHGTDEATLARGVGHLRESSLPVGGQGTHAVLTAHNGFTGARMFDDLHSVEIGDTFSVTAMGERRDYRVDAIEVVAPDQLDSLRQAPGHEYVTLVTCTPRYINSDRLLVRGTFVSVSSEVAPSGDLGKPGTAPGFPWWILLLIAFPLAAVGVLATWFRVPTMRRDLTRT